MNPNLLIAYLSLDDDQFRLQSTAIYVVEVANIVLIYPVSVRAEDDIISIISDKSSIINILDIDTPYNTIGNNSRIYEVRLDHHG